MKRRMAEQVLNDCVSDRLQMAGASVRPVLEPSVTLRFVRGARIQLDGVPPDHLALLHSKVAETDVTLVAASGHTLEFATTAGPNFVVTTTTFEVIWDPFGGPR